MLKWISLLLQLLMLKKSLTKSATAIEYVERTVEKVRGYFLFTVGMLIGGFFLLIALVVAVLAAGLQIEQYGGIEFRGLMISATIFFVIALVIFIVSFLLHSLQRQHMSERERIRQRESQSGSLMPLAEEVLKQVLRNLADRSSSGRATTTEPQPDRKGTPL